MHILAIMQTCIERCVVHHHHRYSKQAYCNDHAHKHIQLQALPGPQASGRTTMVVSTKTSKRPAQGHWPHTANFSTANFSNLPHLFSYVHYVTPPNPSHPTLVSNSTYPLTSCRFQGLGGMITTMAWITAHVVGCTSIKNHG